MPEQQLARGLWSGFAPGENPFGTPNGMDDNLRTIDDHLALYTLQPPVAPGTPLPMAANGDGQIFNDGSYAIFNTGTWATYPARRGITAALADGTGVYINTGAGWKPLDASGIVSVRNFGAQGDSISDDQAPIETAVAACKKSGSSLYWPAGIYVSSASVPDLHNVQHLGPGRIKRDSRIFFVCPGNGQSNTLHVAALGISGDGLSPATPMASIQAALNALKNYGPVLWGSWTVSLAAGTYREPAKVEDLRSQKWLNIVGPEANWGVPTAILDMSGRAEGYGLWCGMGMSVHCKDIKGINVSVAGAAGAFLFDNSVYAWCQNLHTDSGGYAGINANIGGRLYVEGGVFTGGFYGIRAYGGNVFSIGYNSRRVAVRGCSAAGIIIQSSYGHTDYVDYKDLGIALNIVIHGHSSNYYSTFSDCTNAVQVESGSTASTKDCTYSNVLRTRRARDGYSIEDTAAHLNAVQHYPDMGATGRTAYGYKTWIEPYCKYQYSNGDKASGVSLSNYMPCLMVLETDTNTILGLAAANDKYTAVWFGDATNARRGEIRHKDGELNFCFSNTTFYRMRAEDFVPLADNAAELGSASRRWSQVHAGSGAISTSDGRAKQQIKGIPGAVLDAWADVDFCQYKFNDAVSAKAESARWHFGVIAQRVKSAFEARGLDPFAFGLLCYDTWPGTPEELDAGGKVITPARPAGDRYALRYDEALVLEAALMRRELARLRTRMDKKDET